MSVCHLRNLGLEKYQPPYQELSLATSYQSGSGRLGNNSVTVIDYSISGNRLYEHPDGSIRNMPKTPAEVFGEKVLRPVIDRTAYLGRSVFGLLSRSFGYVDGKLAGVFQILPAAEARKIAIQTHQSRALIQTTEHEKVSTTFDSVKKTCEAYEAYENAGSDSEDEHDTRYKTLLKQTFLEISNEIRHYLKVRYALTHKELTDLDYKKSEISAICRTWIALRTPNQKREFASSRLEQLENFYEKKVVFQKVTAKKFVKNSILPHLPGNGAEIQRIAFTSADSHHGGKVPFICEIRNPFLRKKWKIFIKPRTASIDIRILELFKQLNALELGGKSLQQLLPEYKVFNRHGFSVWTYIDGYESHLDAGVFLKELSLKNSGLVEECQLKKKLARLEQISKAICLSDLHHENVIYKNLQQIMGGGYSKKDEEACVDVVPIDLESIQECGETGLYGHENPPNHVKLSAAEEELINQFKEDVSSIRYRYLPLKTADFQDVLAKPTDGEIKKVVNDIIREIDSKNLVTNFDKSTLTQYIKTCFLSREIPYFTRLNKKIYIEGV